VGTELEEKKEKLRDLMMLIGMTVKAMEIDHPDLPNFNLAVVATDGGSRGQVGPMWELGSFIEDVEAVIGGSAWAEIEAEEEKLDLVACLHKIVEIADGKVGDVSDSCEVHEEVEAAEAVADAVKAEVTRLVDELSG
jgi:hypothetical protein